MSILILVLQVDVGRREFRNSRCFGLKKLIVNKCEVIRTSASELHWEKRRKSKFSTDRFLSCGVHSRSGGSVSALGSPSWWGSASPLTPWWDRSTVHGPRSKRFKKVVASAVDRTQDLLLLFLVQDKCATTAPQRQKWHLFSHRIQLCNTVYIAIHCPTIAESMKGPPNPLRWRTVDFWAIVGGSFSS